MTIDLLFARIQSQTSTLPSGKWPARGGYVSRDENRAGQALVTLSVADLDKLVAELADREIRTDPIETVGAAGHKAVVTDPEGNTISFITVTGFGA